MHYFSCMLSTEKPESSVAKYFWADTQEKPQTNTVMDSLTTGQPLYQHIHSKVLHKTCFRRQKDLMLLRHNTPNNILLCKEPPCQANRWNHGLRCYRTQLSQFGPWLQLVTEHSQLFPPHPVLWQAKKFWHWSVNFPFIGVLYSNKNLEAPEAVAKNVVLLITAKIL